MGIFSRQVAKAIENGRAAGADLQLEVESYCSAHAYKDRYHI